MRIYLLVMMLPIFFSGCSDKDKDPLYLDASQPVEKRVNDLMNRMTLQEKVADVTIRWYRTHESCRKRHDGGGNEEKPCQRILS